MSSKEHLQRIHDQAKSDSAHLRNYISRLMKEDDLHVEDVVDLQESLFELEYTTGNLLEKLS